MIKSFDNKYLDEISSICFYYWSKELKTTDRLKKDIYLFLPSYYAFINDYSFVYTDDNDKVLAFALANTKNEKNNSINNFKEKIKTYNRLEINDGIKYIDYLEYNSSKVKNMINDDDLYFGLLASIKHGCGKELIEKVKETAKSLNKRRIFFWTDETCKYEYYHKQGFELLLTYNYNFYSKNIKTFVYKIEL